MAKQSFTVGQVLTAAQLTSLQQTAMLGGAASAKTASYTLVAADAGTTISMTSTSATTVTVNTGLFAAGDTVFIQNLGSGNLTITAGSATVATAGSLILPQNDAGILYFVSTSSSVFYDFIQVGAASPLTTKGDLYTFSTSDTRLAVGATNGHVLTVDSAEATGLKWAAAASGGGMTLLSTTTLSGASTTISSISQAYNTLVVLITGLTYNTSNSNFICQPNAANECQATLINNTTLTLTGNDPIYLTPGTRYSVRTDSRNAWSIQFDNYTATTLFKPFQSYGAFIDPTSNYAACSNLGAYTEVTTGITSLVFSLSGGQVMTAGTVKVYGVK